MDKLNNNQEEKLTKVTLSINNENEIYPLLLNESQIRLLNYLENTEFLDRELCIDYNAKDYKKI